LDFTHDFDVWLAFDVALSSAPESTAFGEEFEDMIAEVTTSFDWMRVWEIFLGASLAFIFGGVLQWRLLARQEKFLRDLEDERSETEAQKESRMREAQARIAARQDATSRKIAMDNRNFEARERSRDRSKLR
jgi:hypothetical protein